MKVKCINIYNDRMKKYVKADSWLTVGKVYTVLEVLILFDGEVSYRFVGDNSDEMPAVYKAPQFQIVSGKTPENWKINIVDNDFIVLGPEAWRSVGFWESCYNLDKEALEIYKKEAMLIYNEHNE